MDNVIRTGKPGRPRYRKQDSTGGAPRVTLRLEPDLYEWVEQQGGARWVKRVLRQMRKAPGRAKLILERVEG